MIRSFVRVFALLLASGSAVFAAEPAATNFYQGKTIQVVVGFGPGGSFDLMARVLARYMARLLEFRR